MTLECALALPLFLMAAVVLCCVLDLFGQVSRKSLSMADTAKKAALAAPAAGDASPEWIDLPGSVPLRIPFPVFGSGKISVPVRARVRSDTGFDADDLSPEDPSEGSGSTVHVTDYDSVYHTHADCTHLDLTVLTSDTASVGPLRNEYGRRYKPCSDFPAGYSGTVYLTAKGDYYYPSPDYPGLTRYVYVKNASDTGGLPLCSRCAEHDHAA